MLQYEKWCMAQSEGGTPQCQGGVKSWSTGDIPDCGVLLFVSHLRPMDLNVLA